MKNCGPWILLMALHTCLLFAGALGFGSWLIGVLILIVLSVALEVAKSKSTANQARQSRDEMLAAGQAVTMPMECEVGRRKVRFREGDEVTLWARPDSSLVYAFLAGTVGGDGKVGWVIWVALHKAIEEKRGSSAVVVDASEAKEGEVRVRVVLEGE